MLIYIILYTGLLASIYFERYETSVNTKRKVIFFWVAVFTLFRGLRWETGTDWYMYLQVFNHSTWCNIFSFERGYGLMEPGYMMLNVLVKSLGGSYTAFLLITNLFVMLVYAFFALTNSKTPIYVFVLIMFSTQFFPVRIGIAVSFVMLGLIDFSARRYIQVALCTAAAISVHQSALVFVPAYFLIFVRKIPTYVAVGVSVAALCIVHIGKVAELLQVVFDAFGFLGDKQGQVIDKAEHYLNYSLDKQGNVRVVSGAFNSLLFIISLGIFGYVMDRQRLQKRPATPRKPINYVFVYNIFFVFVMIGILFLDDSTGGLKRLQNYFMFAFPVLFSLFMVWGQRQYGQYRTVFIAAFVLYCLFRSVTLFFGGYPEAHFPYKSIFNFM